VGAPNDSIRKGGPLVVSFRRSRSPSILVALASPVLNELRTAFAADG
jgi:hypothetical protein